MPPFTIRPAEPRDAAAMADIYNEGIEDRIATFETVLRTPADILGWFDSALALVAAEDAEGQVAGYAVAHPYSDRCCYEGVSEFSVYVRRSRRGQGAGRAALQGLIDAARSKGLWKLLSRVFPENSASLALMDSTGFRRVGVHEKHGKLDGVWKDTVIVERLIPENL
jgi:phosphinothricin acetyltransferase